MNRVVVSDLSVNYRKTLLGSDDRRPRFGWKIRTDARGFLQSAHQIQVATGADFKSGIVWDSGKVMSDQSVHVEYGGPALKSRTRYHWRVRVWDGQGAASDWSKPAWWETAFLARDEWRASWIAAPENGGNGPADGEEEPCDYLRKEFELPGKVASARLYATALGLYRLYVNGAPADDTLFNPGWTSYRKRLQYQTYDVTHLLAEGKNAIGCMLGNGWYKGYLGWKGDKELYGNRRAALIQLHVTLADGSERVIVSDGSWRVSAGPLRMSELYHGERYDARLEMDGWASPGFADGAWRSAAVCDAPAAALVAQENEPVRIIETIKPQAVLTTPEGDTVLDMGQNMVGWVRFTVEAEAGTVITLQHAEVLDRDGNFYTGNLRSARQTITYICRGGGPETYEPFFSFQGFRYVKVTGFPGRDGLTDRFTGCVLHSDLEHTGRFRCSDERVNQLQHNILWGQKGNFLDVPTDCPQRDERMGWTGDAQVFIRTAAFNMNVVPFFEKWLKDLAADQRPDGCVSHVVPDVPLAGYGSAAWGDAAVICPWTLYECYGDRRVLETQYESMKAWVEYIRAQGDDEYLWNTGEHFGDWLALDAQENSYTGATPKDLIATAFYAHSADLLARTAEVLGKAEDAAEYRSLHGNVAAAFRREFVTADGRVAAPTQTAHVLALMFDLLEEKDRPRAAKMLAELIEENGVHLATGFVGTPYLNLVLSRFGYHDLAYRLLLQEEYPSWLFSVRQGATTIWEHWDGIKRDGTFWSDDMNSFNHYAYGAVGDWMYRVVAGINPAAPGYGKIRIAPQISNRLTWAEAAYESVRGTIASAWKRNEDGTAELAVTIPPNTTADVFVPAGEADGIRESGKPLAETPGILRADAHEGGYVLTIGSGTYRFSFSM